MYNTNSYTVWFLYQFIQLLYKLYSTNSYTVWFLYQFRQFLYELYSTNSYFCTNSDNFYTNCIVRIHTICQRTPQGINYLAIRNDPLAFLYEFVSRIGIKKFHRRKHLSPKKLDSPFCPGMWEHVQLCTKKF